VRKIAGNDPLFFLTLGFEPGTRTDIFYCDFEFYTPYLQPHGTFPALEIDRGSHLVLYTTSTRNSPAPPTACAPSRPCNCNRMLSHSFASRHTQSDTSGRELSLRHPLLPSRSFQARIHSVPCPTTGRNH